MKRSVVMTVTCKRPRYLKQTMESWRSVWGLEDWQFAAFCEPAEPRQEEECHQIIVDAVPHAHVWQHTQKQGVLVNPWLALDTGFRGGAVAEPSSYVVLAEEDVLVSNDVLEYHLWHDKHYYQAKGVLAVCSANFSDDDEADRSYLAQEFCPLIWGTWQDRWVEVLRDTWDKDYSTGRPDGSQAGWDWNIGRILKRQNLQCVFPMVSRANHIGEQGGAHMTAEMFKDSQSPNFVYTHQEHHWARQGMTLA